MNKILSLLRKRDYFILINLLRQTVSVEGE